jgi:multiple sugar transport system permease protein
METKNNWKAWLYLAPMLILMTIFTFYPLVNSVLISFYENYLPLANGGRGQVTSFFTLANYTKILGDDLFWVAIKNTFVEAFISVPVSIILSLLIAVGLKSITKLSKFFQTIFFLPYVTNAIAIGMSFAVMFQRNYGLINAILNWFGIEKINWINTGATWWNQMSALLIYSIWSGLAFKILVFTSGLQNIDKQYYDSAKIDSASKWTVFRRITVPLLSPIILYVSITSLIGALKAYNSVIALFGEKLGATQNSMITIVAFVYKYRSGYTDVSYISYAAAAAIILFLITVVLSILQTIVSKKRVHY